MHKVKVSLWTTIVAALFILGISSFVLGIPNADIEVIKKSFISCSLFAGSIIGSAIYAIRTLKRSESKRHEDVCHQRNGEQ